MTASNYQTVTFSRQDMLAAAQFMAQLVREGVGFEAHVEPDGGIVIRFTGGF